MVVKSVVQVVVDTADIIDKDIDIYLCLYNKYKKQIEKSFQLVSAIQECQTEDDFKKMQVESQNKLINELMRVI